LSATFGVRLKILGIPQFPLAPAIAFWVGVQNGFNGLGHDPVKYARSVRCPVLLMQGENDPFVGRDTTRAIAAAIGERATVKILPNCGHSYLARDGEAVWRPQVQQFLAQKVGKARLSAAYAMDNLPE
jgi:pimeloyl-ACP methyl ester carboxylesterase